jgi:hypothetical protein
MHVYAPGADGYIPVEWRIGETAPATAGPVAYPPGRSLHLKAIDETMPVYEGAFELHRDIVIGAAKQAASALDVGDRLVLEGTFRFQACDDRKCYIPEEIPVRWVLQYQPQDSQRVPPELRRLK